MSYYEKYLKYKNKYLRLKNLLGGDLVKECKGKDMGDFLDTNRKSTDLIIEELDSKLNKDISLFTIDEIKTYLAAVDGAWARYHQCNTLDALKNMPKNTCNIKLLKLKNLYVKMIKKWKNIPGIPSINTLIQKEAPNYHAWYMGEIK